ncbi:hypothetical protein FRB90_009730, partial [Tulasnella sp. 427]
LLTELIEKYQDYRARAPRNKQEKESKPAAGAATVRQAQGLAAIPHGQPGLATVEGFHGLGNVGGTIGSEWDFATIKSSARDSRFVFDAEEVYYEGEEEEEGYGQDEVQSGEERDFDDTTASVKGSDGLTGRDGKPNGNGLGNLKEAGHSTVLIKPKVPKAEAAPDLASSAPESTSTEEGPSEPKTPPSPTLSKTSRRSSYGARNDPNGTVLRVEDIGSGMHTVRPVKRVDAVGSLRRSEEYVGSLRSPPQSPNGLPSTNENGTTGSSGSGRGSNGKLQKKKKEDIANAGRLLVDQVVLPTLQKAIRDDMDAREIESLSMLGRGFSDLKEVNPELLYNVVLDILAGMNDNQGIRQHVATQRGLFPHRKITRQPTMTSSGLMVIEHEEAVGPAESQTTLVPPAPAADEAARKSPISDLLYMRWLEGLRIKWPSIL